MNSFKNYLWSRTEGEFIEVQKSNHGFEISSYGFVIVHLIFLMKFIGQGIVC